MFLIEEVLKVISENVCSCLEWFIWTNLVLLTLSKSTHSTLLTEMDKESLTCPQMSTISRDVANYLHLWKPEPILHQNVASPNVFLEPSGYGKQSSQIMGLPIFNTKYHLYLLLLIQ